MDKKKALETAIAQIEKMYGKKSVMRLGEKSDAAVSSISTGSLTLDIALGIGGIPRGRIIEIYGPESSGKTTLALHCIAEAQKAGGEAAFIDAEHALDPEYAEALGVDVDNLLISQPDTGEQALEITEALVEAKDRHSGRRLGCSARAPQRNRRSWASHLSDSRRALCRRLRKLAGVISRQTARSFLSTSCVKRSVSLRVGRRQQAAALLSSIQAYRYPPHGMGGPVGKHRRRTRARVVKNKMAPPSERASSI